MVPIAWAKGFSNQQGVRDMLRKRKLRRIIIALVLIPGVLYWLYYTFRIPPHVYIPYHRLLESRKVDEERFIASIAHFDLPKGFIIPHEYEKWGVNVEYKYPFDLLPPDSTNKMIYAENDSTKEMLIVSQQRQHMGVDLKEVTTEVGKIGRSFTVARPEISYCFSVHYHIPLFHYDDMRGSGNDLIIKGMDVERREDYETPWAQILYYYGKFQTEGLTEKYTVGFLKSHKKWLIFESPFQVFAYRYPQQGAIAIVKSKATGKSLLIACSAPEYGIFRGQVFKKFLGTIRDF